MINRIKSARLALLSMGAAMIAMVPAHAFDAPVLDRAAVIEILREEIKRDPGFVLDAINQYVQDQQVAERQKQDGMAVLVRDELAASADRPFVGSEKAAVELVYFYDVNCGYCKRLDPSLRKIVEENGDVRISHREIPILAESSRSAALISHIVWQMYPKKYGEFHDSLMANQGALSDDVIEMKLTQVVGASEAIAVLDEAANANSEIAKKAKKQVQENLDLATKAGVTGTPFVYILKTDDMMRGAGENAFSQLVDMIAAARAKN